uniref:Xylose isomerase-like TIM barrel domain-containing protein n=1 Tax=Setaria digitata TaxID=48799 RepID=A0A915PWK1_9BILA
MEQNVVTEKESSVINPAIKEEFSNTKIHQEIMIQEPYLNGIRNVKRCTVTVQNSKGKAKVDEERMSDKIIVKSDTTETVLSERSDLKKSAVKQKFIRIKSGKASCSSNSGGRKVSRKRMEIFESTSGTNANISDTTKISTKLDNSVVPKRKCLVKATFKEGSTLVNPIAQKVIEASVKSKKMLGAHVSVAGGLEKSFYNALSIGCRSFAFFVRNQRSWNSPPMKDEVVRAFRETAQILNRARACMLDECKRCEQLGIIYYNIHPGSTAGKCTREECIKTIAATLDYVIDHTEYITILIETMAGQGNTIGGKFEELQQIISLVNNKNRIGVCVDTCHIFAAGYDIRSEVQYKETFTKFESIIGLQYLRAFHINDSISDLGSKLDRHANIGKGKLKLAAFRHLMADPRFDRLPMILETPEGDYADEMIRLYHSLESKPLKEHKKDIKSFFPPL